MAEWSRETSWRQGSVLPDDLNKYLSLKNDFEDKISIVVSHDCDIAQVPDNEPTIEILVGQYVEQLNGAFTNTKNPRKLHIQVNTFQGIKFAEFVAVDKFSIDKMVFMSFEPSKTDNIDSQTMTVLRRWLGIRYTRFAFPDAFDRRLKSNNLDKKIAKALTKHGTAITAIFFDVDNGEEQHRTDPSEVYILDILILYSTESDSFDAEAAAESAKADITKAFEDKLFNKSNQSWTDIELRHCDCLSDEALTYKQSLILKQWRLEHISFAEDPPHPVPVID